MMTRSEKDIESLPLIEGAPRSDAKRISVPEFVPAWEGVRGVAVLMTCISHIQAVSADFDNVTGRGGISIFFVLSGFLITGVLEKRQQQSLRSSSSTTITYRHLPRFYADRFIRLYPALLVLVGFTLFLRKQLQIDSPPQLYGHILTTLTYTVNLVKMPTTNIWDNTWSLGVEEQFYICWSVVLPFVLRCSTARRNVVMWTLILVSFSFALNTHTRIYPSRFDVFSDIYSPFSTFWMMLIGSLVRMAKPLPRFVQRWGAWIGLFTMSLLIFTTSFQSAMDLAYLTGLNKRFFGVSTYAEPVSVACAVSIIVGSMHGNALLETQTLRFLGRISYSLYLYQIPIQFLRSWPRGYEAILDTSFAFLLATISTLYIEEPIRHYYRNHFWKSTGQVKADAVNAAPGSLR